MNYLSDAKEIWRVVYLGEFMGEQVRQTTFCLSKGEAERLQRKILSAWMEIVSVNKFVCVEEED